MGPYRRFGKAWSVIYCPLEHDKKIRAVKEAISSDTLDRPLESNYGEPFFHWDDEQEETKKQFKSFMENGIDVGPFLHLETTGTKKVPPLLPNTMDMEGWVLHAIHGWPFLKIIL